MHSTRYQQKRKLMGTMWAADRVRVHVMGAGCQNFLSACGREGIKLWNLHCAENGYVAWVLGVNVRQLQQLADKGGWKLETLARIGPGRWEEKIRARPGMIFGAVLAIVLLKLFSSFVWNIDFGTQDNPENIRRRLFDCGILEGTAMNDEKLNWAEQSLQNEGEDGWISLHFAEGCLFVETNALHQQEIQSQETEVALYAKSAALILSADVKSGFMAVETGQYVSKGQLLVDNVKFGRTGNMAKQGAAGSVIGKMEKTYTATCNMLDTQTVLRGDSHTETSTYFMGRRYDGNNKQRIPHQFVGCEDESWQPLRLGLLALPGCRKIMTKWPVQKLPVKHTAEYAEATAKRLCRLRLAEHFPDAIVENQEITIEKDDKTVTAVCRYTLRADITQRGTPPEHIFVEP